MKHSKLIGYSIVILWMLASAIGFAKTASPAPVAVSTYSANQYGGVTTCNLKTNHCGPALALPDIFKELTDSEFGYHIDAAAHIPGENKSYLFWGSFCRVFDLDTLKPEGKPVPIEARWGGLSGTDFSKGINAAITDYKNKRIFLIRGPDVVSCDAHTRICGEVKPISKQWPSLTDSEFGYHIDTAANIPGTNKTYLFVEGYYRKFNLDTVLPEGKPVTINGNWAGLSDTVFVKKITAALTDVTHNAILLYSEKNIPGNIPGGGWAGCSSGCGTIGMAWSDNNGNLVGHITVDHLGGGVGDMISAVAWKNVPAKTLRIIKQTHQADVKMIEPIDSRRVIPTIITSAGKSYIISSWAREGDIVVGQRVCQSGWNATTQSKGGVVCGTVSNVGPTDHCRAIGTGKSSCAVTFYHDSGFTCGPGDSGSAVWSENKDGTIMLLGTIGSNTGSSCKFEPIYATSQIFGGRPYTQ